MYVKFLKAVKAGARDQLAAIAYAKAAPNWSTFERERIVARIKAGVAGGGVDGSWGSELHAEGPEATFVAEIRDQELVSKIPHRRIVPANTLVNVATSGTTVTFRGEGAAIRVTKAALARTQLRPMSIAGAVVVSNELLDNPQVEPVLGGSLRRGTIEAMDRAFLSGAANGPSAITAGCPVLTASGVLKEDLASMVWTLAGRGSAATACWIAHPMTLTSIALAAAGLGLAANLGPAGGTLLGLPAFASEEVEIDSDGAGSLVLLDGAQVVVVDEGVQLVALSESMIEQDDAPAGNALTPVAASATLISLWQNDLTALVAIRKVDWMLAREGAAIVLSGANY